MQCSTTDQSRQLAEPLPPAGLENWEDLVRCVPSSVALDVSARLAGALLRRREVKCAADLLRIVLGYAVCDWPLRTLGAWCEMKGLGHLSAVALRKRLKHCNRWLGKLIMAIFQAEQIRLPAQAGGLQLRIQDATTVSHPGSQGTNWRLHLSLNAGQGCIDGVELTDVHGGETLARFPVQPGEIRLADAGYAQPVGLGSFLHNSGQIVVRFSWQNLRLEEEDGRRFDLIAWLGEPGRASTGEQERTVWLPTPQGRFALRMVVCPLPPDKAEEARRRARKASAKKKHNVDERTLLAAGFVLLLTNLPTERWSARAILQLYRIRWQVELVFKRLKSLLVLDGLRAQDSELAQTYLLGKVLGALLLGKMTGRIYSCISADWDLQARPISCWRVTALCLEALKNLIRGSLTQAMITEALPRLMRFLCDGPRKRPSQQAAVQRLLHALSGC